MRERNPRSFLLAVAQISGPEPLAGCPRCAAPGHALAGRIQSAPVPPQERALPAI